MQMRQVTTALVALWLTATMSGCATIMSSGTSQEVTFDSSPSGVEIYMDGNKLGVTPFSANLPRPRRNDVEAKDGKVVSTHDVVARKDGFEDQKISIMFSMNPWVWVDIIFMTGLLGTTSLAVDSDNGTIHEYEPNHYFITLIPVKASQAERAHIAKQIRLRDFVLTSYANLRSDLARGEGEYVESLSALADRRDVVPTITELRKISRWAFTVPTFAEAVVERFCSAQESC